MKHQFLLNSIIIFLSITDQIVVNINLEIFHSYLGVEYVFNIWTSYMMFITFGN